MIQATVVEAATWPSPSGAPAPHPLSRVLGGGRPLVCGILNVTSDSFSDGGLHDSPERAVEHGRRLAVEGADLIDIGGESTRPSSRPPTLAEELDRVVPVVEALARRIAVPLSVDTSRPEVMRAAVAAGACMINDVRALRTPDAGRPGGRRGARGAGVRHAHAALAGDHAARPPLPGRRGRGARLPRRAEACLPRSRHPPRAPAGGPGFRVR